MDMGAKRVLVITNMYPGRISNTFGIFVKNQVEALKEKGISIDVAAVNDPRMGKKFVLLKYMKWLLNILRILVTKGKRYDLIHAHYVFPSGWLALLFKRLLGSKLVVTAHGGDIDKMPKKNKWIFKQTQKVLQNSDHIIAVGEALRDEIVSDFKVDASKITVMSMGVNRQVFAPSDKSQAQNQLNLSPDRKHLLYVGNIIEAKGLLELIRAYNGAKEKAQHLELHLIGAPKQESFKKQLQDVIREENIEGVQFHGPKTQKEVALWMSAADLFVLPSYIEGFGLVAVEAMSCHTPVVGTDVGGLSYLLKDNHGVLVKPKDIASLQHGIQTVLDDPSLERVLITNGEKRAKENDQSQLLNKLQEIYTKIGAN
jgi:glycosyltransferase involved in cell wall biosynthesis